MSVSRILVVVAFILAGALLGGCCGGGTTEVKTVSAPQTTLGDELKDLQEAYEKGAISKEDYEEAKEKIIKQRTKKE